MLPRDTKTRTWLCGALFPLQRLVLRYRVVGTPLPRSCQ
ncbi:hypothetical protein CJF30_00010427 [Rutstroemia sp. NJR-2017a BBW]|nr:hypothetical protein CJF30_00010427 [Rutstroemia sp. NJR-2017a BBW]